MHSVAMKKWKILILIMVAGEIVAALAITLSLWKSDVPCQPIFRIPLLGSWKPSSFQGYMPIPDKWVS